MRKSTSLKNIEGVKRGDAYSANPLEIIVNFEDNPRIDYGGELFEDLKRQIAQNGVEVPLKVFVNNEGKLELGHGFRRMRAVMELIAEGHMITSVPFEKIDNNEETILRSHFILNGGLPMSDAENCDVLLKYQKLTNKSTKEIAHDMGIDYNKAHRLINFAKDAGSQLKEAVKGGELSITNAVEIAKQTNSITEQNDLLEKARESAKANGQEKIKPSDLKIVQPTVSVAKVVGKLRTIQALDEGDTEFVNNVLELLEAFQRHDMERVDELVGLAVAVTV